MNIKSRIWSLPVISALIFALGLAVSSYYASSALGAIQNTGDVDYPMLSQSAQLQGAVQSLAEELRNAVLEGDKKRLETVDGSAAKLAADIEHFGAIPGQAELAGRLGKQFSAYYGKARSASRIMLEVEPGDAASAIPAMQATFNTLSASLAQAVRDGQAQFTGGIQASTGKVRMVLVSSIAVAVIIILGLAIVSYFVVRAIWQQLGGEPEYACHITRAIADGDLSIDIALAPGHPDSLLAALVEMQTRLAGIVAGIQGAGEAIRQASGEIASGNADLSARNESQAHNLGSAAQSMVLLTGNVQQNADSARDATDLANAAASVALKGGAVVDQVVATMSAISASSHKIADIIGVIDGIAFQTNILALNAAVEAARAGEQGRGFAVVASEVRNLAQRSAAAAREIKQLIGESVAQVGQGSALVENAGRTMSDIVASVQRVSHLIAEISASSQEQSKGLENLSGSVNQMDQSTQQNAAMTEQAAAAASSLQEQAVQLSAAIGIFKLSATHAPRTRPELLQVR